MSAMEAALARLERAMEELETAMADGLPELDAEVEALRRERDGLADEVDALRASAERDAALRAEAADAVRMALSDLRAMVPDDVAPEDRADG